MGKRRKLTVISTAAANERILMLVKEAREEEAAAAATASIKVKCLEKNLLFNHGKFIIVVVHHVYFGSDERERR